MIELGRMVHPLVILLSILPCSLVLVHGASRNIDEVSCRDPNGNEVEWFIMYKAPKTGGDKKSNKFEIQGSEYGYIDSKSKNFQVFEDGYEGIFSEKNNPLANSLNRLFVRQRDRTDKELTYAVYNDQPPSELSNSTSNGHTKGVVLFGDKKGLWIVHSVPKFPEQLFSGKYSFPNNARENGQSVLCITTKLDQLQTIAAHLRKQNPNIYAANAPADVRSKIPEVDLLVKKKFSRTQPFSVVESLIGVKGTVFKAFAKSGRFNKDVYSAAIAPTLESDLFVQSWRNGNGGKLPPDCKDKYKVTDVQKLSSKFGQKTLKWPSSEDHSKWAVTDKNHWTCIGSINRMFSQFTRGGETICIQHAGVQQLFYKAIDAFAPCELGGIQTRSRVPNVDATMEASGRDAGTTTETALPTTTTTEKSSAIRKFYENQKQRVADGFSKLFSG